MNTSLKTSDDVLVTADRKLRVLHLVPSVSEGGAEKVMFDLASHQISAGHEVIVVSIARRNTPPAWFHSEHGDWNSVRSLDWPLRYDKPMNLWGARRKLRQVLIEFKPDILHSHLWAADIVASLSVDPQKTLHVSHLHTREKWKDSRRWKHRLRRLFSRWLFQRSKTRFIACSPAVKDNERRVMGWPAELIDVAQNAANSERFQPSVRLRTGCLRVGSAGWFSQIKGHSLLIDSVADLVSEDLDLELVIAGDGSLREDYLRQASRRGIAERLILPGSVTDMPAFYQSLDLFVLPSYEEGMPLVVLEAIASGLCVVASALPGMEDAVQPEVNGLLFPIGDRPALTAALRRILRDPELASRMGTASRRIALQGHTPGAAARHVEAIYRRRLEAQATCQNQ